MSKNNKEEFYTIHEICLEDFVGKSLNNYADAVNEATEIANEDDEEESKVLILKVVGLVLKKKLIVEEKL